MPGLFVDFYMQNWMKLIGCGTRYFCSTSILFSNIQIMHTDFICNFIFCIGDRISQCGSIWLGRQTETHWHTHFVRIFYAIFQHILLNVEIKRQVARYNKRFVLTAQFWMQRQKKTRNMYMISKRVWHDKWRLHFHYNINKNC